MTPLLKPILPSDCAGRIKRAIIFISGTGSNAVSLLNYCQDNPDCGFAIVGIFTDRPLECHADKIGAQYRIPVASSNIKQFYLEHGETSIALTSESRRMLREQWTNSVREAIKDFKADFIMLAGFIPLCNIAKDYPTLNVHPGNLLVEENGQRLLAGLHYIPVETAILRKLGKLRSSVILAQAFGGSGNEMDTGPILGISTAVEIDLLGYSVEDLIEVNNNRANNIAKSGAPSDALRQVARHNIELLKSSGDHIVFPRVAAALSKGEYMRDQLGSLYFRGEIVRTVEFGAQKTTPVRVSK